MEPPCIGDGVAGCGDHRRAGLVQPWFRRAWRGGARGRRDRGCARACARRPVSPDRCPRPRDARTDGGQDPLRRHRRIVDPLGTKQILLENTVESIRDAVIVVDEHAVIVVANAAARRLLGVDRGFDSLTGTRKFACFRRGRRDAAANSGFSAGAGATRRKCRRLRTGRAIRSARCAGLIVANARPLRDAAGHLRGAVTVLRDVTEQKRAHQALVDSEQMAQSIVQHRARRLRPDRRKRLRPRLEPTGRSLDRLDPGGGASA